MTWEMFDHAVDVIYKKIKQSNTDLDLILAIPKGGLTLGVSLANMMGMCLETEVMKVTPNSRVLLVDDVADTGNTLSKWVSELKQYTPNVKIATLYYKPHCILVPEFYAYVTEKWIEYPWERKAKTI
jgi:hypothetical protein